MHHLLLCALPGHAEVAQRSLGDDLSSRAVRYDGDVRPGLLVQLKIGQNCLAIPCTASDKSPQQDAMAVERVEELPQHIADWISGGIVPCIYCV